MPRVEKTKAGNRDAYYLTELAHRILESAHDIIVATDREGLITFFNPAAERFSSYSREEVLGTHICATYKDSKDCRRSLALIVETGQGHTHESIVITKGGEEKNISVSRAPLKNAQGRIIGFISSARDITEERKSQERLRYLEEFSNQILNSAHDVIVATDQNGMITYCNPAAEDAFAYTREELMGSHICSLHKDREKCLKSFEQLALSGGVYTFEAVIVRKSGDERILSVSRAPLRDREGTVTGFVSSSRDVTEEMRHLERIRELQDFTDCILNSAHDLISVTDTRGRLSYVNQAWIDLTGYTREEVMGRYVSTIYKDPSLSDQQLDIIQRTSLAKNYDAVILDKEGQEHTLSVNKALLKDKDGMTVGFVAVSRDLSRSNEAIETLRHVQDFLEQILNSTHDIIVATDIEGRITYYNQAAEEITGYSRGEAVGMNISDMYKDHAFSDRQMELIRKTRRTNKYEAVIVDKKGEEHILSVHKAPLKDSMGRINGFVAVSRDITLPKKAEEKLEELTHILSQDASIQVEPHLLRKKVSDIMSRNPLACRCDERIGSVINKLISGDTPLLPVLDEQDRVLGTISLKDLAARRLFGDENWRGRNAADFINPTFYTVEKDTLFFDALAVMVKNRVETLIVQAEGFLEGVITFTDMVKYRGLGVLNILDHIDGQDRIESLAEIRPLINHFIQSLLLEGALPSQICSIITEFNDKITRRVLELVIAELGRPPASFAWLGLGSEGRKEQTIVADQDNAIIIDCLHPMPMRIKNYFDKLTKKTIEGLHVCGFPYCKGGIMAKNPDWSGTPDVWLNRVRHWMKEPSPENLLAFITFADQRMLYGSETLFTEFRRKFLEMCSQNPRSLSYFAEAALQQSTPLNLFRQFIVEKSGEYKGKLNIKNQGTSMVINMVRVFALKEGIQETNTWERIEALKDKEVLQPEEAESLKEAFNHLMDLRLKNMVHALQEKQSPDNYIQPHLLSHWNQKMLKQAFDVINRVNKLGREIFWWL